MTRFKHIRLDGTTFTLTIPDDERTATELVREFSYFLGGLGYDQDSIKDAFSAEIRELEGV